MVNHPVSPSITYAKPQWRLHRDELNRAPLAHEEWGY
jgi:hypothetical protein